MAQVGKEREAVDKRETAVEVTYFYVWVCDLHFGGDLQYSSLKWRPYIMTVEERIKN